MGTKKGGFYAVGKGRQPGVYTSWSAAPLPCTFSTRAQALTPHSCAGHRDETLKQVTGFPRAAHKKFQNMHDAQEFVRSHTPGWTPNASAGSSQAGSSASASSSQAASARGIGGRQQQTQRRGNAPEYQRARPQGKLLGSQRRDEGQGSLVGSTVAQRKVYCDGSALGNGKYGAAAGIGVWWSHEIGAP